VLSRILGIIGVFEVAVDDTLSVSVETRSERMSVVEIQPAPGARRSATIPPHVATSGSQHSDPRLT